MAKKTTAAAAVAATPAPPAAPAAEAPKFAVGQETTFKAYVELQEGVAPVFQPGDKVRVSAIDKDGNFTVVDPANPERVDTVFDDELNPATAPAPRTRTKAAPATPATAPAATGNPPAAAKGKGKGKAAGKTKNLAAASKAKPVKAPKAPAAPKEEAAPVVLVDTPQVAESMQGDALEAAQVLVNQGEENDFTLGGILAHIYHEELYKPLGEAFSGKGGWQKYVEEILPIGYNKAMKLIDIYMTFTAIELTQDDLTEIGWAKARALTKPIRKHPEKAQELLNYAKDHTKDEVADYVKVTYGSDAGGTGSAQPTERTKKVKFKFTLSDAEAESANAALEAAKSRGESSDLSQAFLLMATEWASLSGGVEVSLEDAIANLNAKYGVNLVAEEAAEEETAQG